MIRGNGAICTTRVTLFLPVERAGLSFWGLGATLVDTSFDTNPEQRCETLGNELDVDSAYLCEFCNIQQQLELCRQRPLISRFQVRVLGGSLLNTLQIVPRVSAELHPRGDLGLPLLTQSRGRSIRSCKRHPSLSAVRKRSKPRKSHEISTSSTRVTPREQDLRNNGHSRGR